MNPDDQWWTESRFPSGRNFLFFPGFEPVSPGTWDEPIQLYYSAVNSDEITDFSFSIMFFEVYYSLDFIVMVYWAQNYKPIK